MKVVMTDITMEISNKNAGNVNASLAAPYVPIDMVTLA
jgi:hypothetical protein